MSAIGASPAAAPFVRLAVPQVVERTQTIGLHVRGRQGGGAAKVSHADAADGWPLFA